MVTSGSHRNNILIVEDDATVCFALADVLEDKGYDVLPALNGRDALIRLAGRPKPDVIVLDLEKRRKDGWAFLEYRNDHPAILRIPLIVLYAGNAQFPHVHHAAGFMTKPVSADTLLSWLLKLGIEPNVMFA